MYQSEQINEIAIALAKVQAVLEAAEKNSTNTVGGGGKKKYADIAAVYSAIREPLSNNGLSIAQTMRPSDPGTVCVRTMLMHESGQWISGECVLPWDRQGGPQGAGSAITYARRYSLSAMIGVVSEDDDDGLGAMPKSKSNSRKTPESPTDIQVNFADRNQVQRIQILMKEMGIDDRDVRIARTNTWLAKNGGHEITSTNELTKQQAAKLIATLEKQIADSQALPGQDPFPHVTQ